MYPIPEKRCWGWLYNKHHFSNQFLHQGVILKFNKICVMGLGYIGLPTASTFAAHGIKVIGVDVNSKVVETLRNGGLHIHEPGLRTVVEAALKSGQLTVSTRPEEADAFIIAVPTPFFDDKRADMRAVESATKAILPYLRRGNLVVLESTSPPCTTVNLVAPILEKSGLKAGMDFYLTYSPERVLPGQIMLELIENARVIGGVTPESARVGHDLYAIFVKGEIVETDATTAEMVKLMENTFRDVNIAIANEFSRLADRFGINIWEAIALANRHPRINFLSPGLGVGGHCISVDPWFLVEAAPDLTPLIQTSRKVNDSQPRYILDLIKRAIHNLKDKRIAALGLSYKPDVDDLRESPAIEVIHLMQKEGSIVTAFEPFKPGVQLPGLSTVASLEEAVSDSEVVILLVNHSQFHDLKPSQLRKLTPARILIDTINGWGGKEWDSTGFIMFRLGAK
jgi:UDP-N-acetyl-D-mannosaminuronic acid dehydrogenase